MKKYFPYPANDGKHKYYIKLMEIKKKYFGAAGMSDFTIHKDVARKQRYIDRHKKNENCWWSLKYQWSYPTKEEAHNHIKKDLKNGVLFNKI